MHDQERCILRDIAASLLEVEAGILWCALIGVQLNCTFRRVSRTAATRLQRSIINQQLRNLVKLFLKRDRETGTAHANFKGMGCARRSLFMRLQNSKIA